MFLSLFDWLAGWLWLCMPTLLHTIMTYTHKTSRNDQLIFMVRFYWMISLRAQIRIPSASSIYKYTISFVCHLNTFNDSLFFITKSAISACGRAFSEKIHDCNFIFHVKWLKCAIVAHFGVMVCFHTSKQNQQRQEHKTIATFLTLPFWNTPTVLSIVTPTETCDFLSVAR